MLVHLALAPALFAWEPIDPADLVATVSSRRPEAGLEYLFWRESFTSGGGLTVFTRVRAKLYDARGVAQAAALSVESDWNGHLKRLAARVVKPDGMATELRTEDFLHSEVAKVGRRKIRRTSFVFPSLAPGDIVDFQWEVIRDGESSEGFHFCQQHAPVREYSLDLPSKPLRMFHSTHQLPPVDAVPLSADRYRLVTRDLPAYVPEPQMPPELESRGWILLQSRRLNALAMWKIVAHATAGAFDSETKPNDALRRKSAELVAGSVDEEEKILRLYDFCRLAVVNIDRSDDPLAREQRQKRGGQVPQSPKETLQRGRGRSSEINALFAALVRGVGFEVRLARIPSNATVLDCRETDGWMLLSHTAVAVKHGGTWKFHDPATGVLPYGMLDRFEEGQVALICDRRTVIHQQIPVSPASASKTARKARFTLRGDGGLEGTVWINFTGHPAAQFRQAASDAADEQLSRNFAEEVRWHLPAAEVSEVTWENLRQMDGPVTVRYQVTVPGYAEATGTRLVLAPSYFTRGAQPVFTAIERHNDLFWQFGWVDEDDIEIVLPPGFELEQASEPTGVPDDNGLVALRCEVGYAASRHALSFKRHFTFDVARKGQHLSRGGYPELVGLFNAVRAADEHSYVLRPRKAFTVPAAGAGAAP